MRPSDDRILLVGVALWFVQLLIVFIFLYVGGELWAAFGSWKTCSDFGSCKLAENQYMENIRLYEFRAFTMGLSVFGLLYIAFRKYSEEIVKTTVVTLSLSLVWLPGLMMHWNGNLRDHTLDAVLFIIIGGAFSAYLIKKKHATKVSAGALRKSTPPQ